jgi:radical SAM superfamily enzyme YgiQ (UPF0313 family)
MTTSRRLMLVEPPFYRLYQDSFGLVKYPLALGYLSGMVLRETDWHVQTYNADFSLRREPPPTLAHMAGQGYVNYVRSLSDLEQPIWGEVEAALMDFAPSVIGISSKTQNFASARNVAAIARRLYPGALIILGGPHASMAGREALASSPDFDIAVVGEGEQTLVDLLKALEDGRDLRQVDGLILRGQDGAITATQPRAYIEDLDTLPYPHESAAQTLRDYEHYPPGAFKFVFATRGCPYSCQFCGSRNIWTRRVRYRSAANVAEEVRRLRALGLGSIHFDDDTFGVSKKYIASLCDAISEVAPGITWSCETSVNVLDDDVVGRMRAAGCVDVQIGVESGSNSMLKTIRKNITIEKALDGADLLKRHGIRVQTFFIAGFPEETEETLEATRQAIRKINSDYIIFSIYTPYPGTENYEICKKIGLINDSYDVTLFNHQNPENCFTANIPPARFKALVTQLMQEVDSLNARKNRRSRRDWLVSSGLTALREKGVVYTLAKVAGVSARAIKRHLSANSR